MPPDPRAAGWALDAQLQRDTTTLGDLPLSRLLLGNDATYPWLILVPRRRNAVEIVDLDTSEQAELMGEIADVSRALRAVTACDKLNIAAIGNVVPQLHIHVIARRRGDAAWPRPVWGAVPPRDYEPAAREQLIVALRGRLAAISA